MMRPVQVTVYKWHCSWTYMWPWHVASWLQLIITRVRGTILPPPFAIMRMATPKYLASFPGLHTQLLSLALRKAGGKPGRIYHMMRAADVPTLTILFS